VPAARCDLDRQHTVVRVCIIHCSHDHSHQIHSLSMVYYVAMDIQSNIYLRIYASSSPPGFNQTAAKQHHTRACRWGLQPQVHTPSIANTYIISQAQSRYVHIINIRYPPASLPTAWHFWTGRRLATAVASTVNLQGQVLALHLFVYLSYSSHLQDLYLAHFQFVAALFKSYPASTSK